MLIRKAEIEDSGTLSELAYKSKAYWGYSKDFLEKCKDDLTVTTHFIKNNPVYVMEENKELIAFYSFSFHPDKLESLFIDPSYIGKGIGKILWLDVIHKAKQLKMKEFHIDSDPHAEGFYLKMGAMKIGDTPSTVFPERLLPLLIFHVDD